VLKLWKKAGGETQSRERAAVGAEIDAPKALRGEVCCHLANTNKEFGEFCDNDSVLPN